MGEPAADVAIKKVKDRAVRYTFVMTLLALLAGAVGFVSGVGEGFWKSAAPYAAFLVGATTTVVGFYKFTNERAYKAHQIGSYERPIDSAAESRDANAGPSFTSAYPPPSPLWLQRGRLRRTRRNAATPVPHSTRGIRRVAVRGTTAVGKRLDESPYTAWLRDQRRTIRRAARYASWVSSTTAIAFFNPYTPQNRPGPRPGCRHSSGTMC